MGAREVKKKEKKGRGFSNANNASALLRLTEFDNLEMVYCDHLHADSPDTWVV